MARANDAGLSFESEKLILVPYRDGRFLGNGSTSSSRVCVLIELKAIPKLRRIHHQQVVAYLRATKLEVGLLLNFNTILPERQPQASRAVITNQSRSSR